VRAAHRGRFLQLGRAGPRLPGIALAFPLALPFLGARPAEYVA